MGNKKRTVFYAEEGAKTYIDRVLNTRNFKSESDVICYLIALGMKADMQQQIATAAAVTEADHGTLE